LNRVGLSWVGFAVVARLLLTTCRWVCCGGKAFAYHLPGRVLSLSQAWHGLVSLCATVRGVTVCHREGCVAIDHG
jgi:hypothetical protein